MIRLLNPILIIIRFFFSKSVTKLNRQIDLIELLHSLVFFSSSLHHSVDYHLRKLRACTSNPFPAPFDNVSFTFLFSAHIFFVCMCVFFFSFFLLWCHCALFFTIHFVTANLRQFKIDGSISKGMPGHSPPG